MKKIIFTTFRENKKATGGPGGVLYLQETVLGKKVGDYCCEYRFSKHFCDSVQLNKLFNYCYCFIRYLFTKNTYFFCHDINMAYMLALLGKKYSLLYHHQGPLVEEMLNLGEKLNKSKIDSLSRRERVAFIHAHSVHFPANGAADMYFSSKYANCKRDEVKLSYALYNIIPLVSPITPVDYPLVKDNTKLTLFSLGTLTVAKGQDKVVEFLKQHINEFSKPVRYIMVGNGPLKERLLEKLDALKKEHPSFDYYHYESVPHDIVMYLHKISDIYIMLHRISIFDFATLEAMSQRSAVILSKVGGNIDFNMDNNIIYAEDVNHDNSILVNADIKLLQKKNYDVFCDKFSKEAFIKQYQEFFKKILE